MEDNSKETLNFTINSLCPWMSFHGWLYIVFGIFYCLSIVGVVFGIPLIVAGVGLLESNSNFSKFLWSGKNIDLEAALKRQKQFFLTTGILFLVSFGLPILIIVSLLLTFAFNPNFNDNLSIEINKVHKIPKLNSPNKMPYEFNPRGKEI
ncbi:MAG: DUF5362 family protein [Candidatus Caenarcaniphilales bacterium]|nr:DUF5362 family protein [Candidatus Caenarcaniphilales bacterium]